MVFDRDRCSITKRRVEAMLIIAIVMCLKWSVDVTAFMSPQLSERMSSTRRHSATVPRESSSQINEHRIEFVDFWGMKLRRDDAAGEQVRALPADANLDRHSGPLPPGAYQLHGNPNFDPKQTCRIVLSIDWQQKHSRFARAPLDGDQVVRQTQRCLDAGFQSFQIARRGSIPPDIAMLGRIIQETPKFVEMHWTVPLNLPNQISPSVVRETVFDLISKTKTDALDTVLVPYNPNILPQYHLEVLDVLQDLQRNGYHRSIGVENWPDVLVKEAQHNGFCIETHQRKGNLLLPPPRTISKGDQPANVWTDPLAGNLLSVNNMMSRHPPVYSPGWNDVRTWHRRIQRGKKSKKEIDSASDEEIWRIFKKDVLEILHFLSSKHEVSIASVVLRWSLQEKSTTMKDIIASCVVYPLFLVEEPEGYLAKELHGLRDVFRFHLDNEDLESLNSVTAQPKAKATTLRIDDMDVPLEDIPLAFLRDFEAFNVADDDEMEGESEQYPEIDFNNPMLWL